MLGIYLLTVFIHLKPFVSQVSLEPADFLVWMLPLGRRVCREYMGTLESPAGKDSKEIKDHLDTGGQMVFLERKVSMTCWDFSRINLL